VLPDSADLALELLGDATLRPALRSDRLEIERESALAGLHESLDDVVTFGRKKLREKFFGAHPLAVESGGDEGGLKAIKVPDLREIHRRLVVSGNAVLAVAGDFDPKRLGPRLQSFLARLPKGRVQSAAMRPDGIPGEFVETQPRQQAVVFQAFPGPGLCEADFDTGDVAEELFSGMSSNLFERVREQRSLAYFVRSSRVTGLQTGMFYFFAGTSPQQAGDVLEEFAREIARVRDGGATEAELARCRTRLKAARRMSMQTNSARAMQAALNGVCGLPINDARTYDARIDAVTAPVVQAFARKYFAPKRMVQLVVKPS
jgi:zinc protease